MQTASRYPWGKGTPTWVRDATANDSDKTFTVPAATGKIWSVKDIHVDLTSTATVGNRTLQVTFGDGANVLAQYFTLNQAAGQTWGYDFWPTATRNVLANPFAIAIPEYILLAGYTIRVYDASAIDPAADDMTVILHYIEYDE